MHQNRLRSPVVWASVVAQLVAILLVLGVIDTGTSGTIEQIAALLLQALTLFGVLNNPTEKKSF